MFSLLTVQQNTPVLWIQHLLSMRIRIQGFDDQKLAKKVYIFLFKKSNFYLSLGLHKGRPSKENIQHIKFINFFLCLQVIFSLLDQESGSTALALDVLPGSVHLVLLLLMEGAIFGGEFPVGFLQAQLLGVNGQHLCLLLLLSML